MTLRIHTICLLLAAWCFCGCKKLVEVDPPVEAIVGKEIYNTNVNAASVLTGMYAEMSNGGIFTGRASMSVGTSLSGDELTCVAGQEDILSILFTNTLTNNGNQLFWTSLYEYIFRANAAIEGLAASTGVSEPVRKQLTGEAKFIRAFMYFYLVNLYGNVPLVLGTNANENRLLGRTMKETVYEQIVNDLKEADALMNDEYVYADAITPTAQRTRPNKMVAVALLSRVYLYMGKWALAEEEATRVISRTDRYRVESLSSAFISTSKEAIWQLQPVGIGFDSNTRDATVFILAAGGSYAGLPGPNRDSRPVYISDHLYNTFETGDQRREQWIDTVIVRGQVYPYAYKYKLWITETTGEYLVVLRLGEQYLIRAEARAQQGRVTGINSAAADLNMIRARAGLGETSATTQSTMLDAIMHERQAELFTEWGHRWMDLKRTGKVDAVMASVAPAKGGVWQPYKAVYPLPIQDIQQAPGLRGHQNPGYPEQ